MTGERLRLVDEPEPAIIYGFEAARATEVMLRTAFCDTSSPT